MRLFIGVRLAAECANQLRDTASEMAAAADKAGEPRIRWVDPACYHVTLKFLGWARPEAIAAIRDRVGAVLAGRRGFRFRVAGAGAFPRPEAARVLWAGIEASAELAELAELIAGAVEPLGFRREKRPFHAHVTLGRVRKAGDLSKLLVVSERVYRETSCDAVVLFESEMKPTGSEYIERWEWRLQSGRRQRADLEQRDT